MPPFAYIVLYFKRFVNSASKIMSKRENPSFRDPSLLYTQKTQAVRYAHRLYVYGIRFEMYRNIT